MDGARHSLLSILMLVGCGLMLLYGCGARAARHDSARTTHPAGQAPPSEGGIPDGGARPSIYPDDQVELWIPCTQEEIEELSAEADQDGLKALQAASCHAALVVRDSATGRSGSLDIARDGRRYAEMACREFPESGLAHYLAALLTGLEAEHNPARGLQMVPVIEREAILASRLNPAVDHGGPDRLLGELYLRAPGFPMSLGDSAKSAAHFRRALTHDADHMENRLGLVEALMAGEENREACRELSVLIAGAIGQDRMTDSVKIALNLLNKLCSRLEE